MASLGTGSTGLFSGWACQGSRIFPHQKCWPSLSLYKASGLLDNKWKKNEKEHINNNNKKPLVVLFAYSQISRCWLLAFQPRGSHWGSAHDYSSHRSLEPLWPPNLWWPRHHTFQGSTGSHVCFHVSNTQPVGKGGTPCRISLLQLIGRLSSDNPLLLIWSITGEIKCDMPCVLVFEGYFLQANWVVQLTVWARGLRSEQWNQNQQEPFGLAPQTVLLYLKAQEQP